MKKLLSLLSITVLLSACGVEKMFDMPNKMDKMNDKMDKMSAGLDSTNSITEQMKALMKDTVSGVQKQEQLLPFEKLMDVSNYDVLDPVPFKIMPWAEELSKVLPADKFALLAFLMLKEIKETQMEVNFDDAGNVVPPTRQELKKFATFKNGRLAVLKALSGFYPEEKIDELIQLHVIEKNKKEGRFSEQVKAIAVLRVDFIRNVLLKEGPLKYNLSDLAKIDQSISYIQQIDKLAKLSLEKKIAFNVEVGGLLNQKTLQTKTDKYSIDLKTVKEDWELLKFRIEGDYNPEEINPTGDANKDLQLKSLNQTGLNGLMSTVDSAISFWETVVK